MANLPAGFVPDEPDKLPPGFVPDEPAKPTTDMSAAARRAQSGRAPGPRELTDEEAGVDTGPVGNKTVETIVPGLHETRPVQAVGPNAEAPPTDYVTRRPTPGGGETIRVFTGNPNEMGDPGAQAMTSAAMGRVAAIPAAALPARAASVVAPAVEGEVANQAMGGDTGVGAALAAAGPAAKVLGGAARDAAMATVGKNAPARVARRQTRNLTENASTGKRADKIAKVAGPEGEDLAQVIGDNEELGHALAVHAANKPKAALTAVTATKDAANAARNEAFETMQTYWADKPASAQASIPQMLDDYKALRGERAGLRDRAAVIDAATTELKKFGDELREAQGLPPAVNGDYSGTVVSPKDLRDFEQTIGRRINDTVKGKVHAEIYRPIARQVNQLAENTPGLDAKAFARGGKTIHTLIPIEEDLVARVAKQDQGRISKVDAAIAAAKMLAGGGAGFMGGGVSGAAIGAVAPTAAKHVAGALAGAGRRLDYRLARAQLDRVRAAQAARAPGRPALAPAAVGVAAAAPERRGGFADLMPAPVQ